MALGKTIVTSTLAPAVYHRIVQATIDWTRKLCTCTVASFYSKEARDQNKGCLSSEDFTFHDKKFPFPAESMQAFHSLLGLSSNQEIVNAKFAFHGDTVHVSVVVSKEVLGKETTTEESHSVPKAQMPVDLLAALYTLIGVTDQYTGSETV